MKFFVDAGNSRIKWRVGPEGVVHVCDWGQLDDLPDLLLASAEGVEPKRIVIASVVEPARAEALGDYLEEVWPGVTRQWLKVAPRSNDLVLGYRDPKQLGVDRYCAMLAAHHDHRGANVIVVHVGTAMTLDVVTAEGRHEGGLIMPGYSAMLGGLAIRAPVLLPATEAARLSGLLPEPGAKEVPSVGGLLANDTQKAITLGCHWMLAAALQSALVAIQDSLPVTEAGETKVLLSGGDAERLQSLLGDEVGPVSLAPDLVLDGAVLLSKRQR